MVGLGPLNALAKPSLDRGLKNFKKSWPLLDSKGNLALEGIACRKPAYSGGSHAMDCLPTIRTSCLTTKDAGFFIPLTAYTRAVRGRRIMEWK